MILFHIKYLNNHFDQETEFKSGSAVLKIKMPKWIK